MMTNFGIERKKGIWDEYIGQWVVIRPQGINTTYRGKFAEIKEDYVVLSPFQDGHYGKEGIFYRISSKRSLVPLVGNSIEPTSRRNIENFCRFHNEEIKKARKRNHKTK